MTITIVHRELRLMTSAEQNKTLSHPADSNKTM